MPTLRRYLAVLVAIGFFVIAVAAFLAQFEERTAAGDEEHGAGTPPPAEGSQPPTARASGELERRLDRDWATIFAVLKREYPDSIPTYRPPADDDAIAQAEKAVGFDFPAELRWLLRQHDGQEPFLENKDPSSEFYNGDRLMSAAEVASDYLMIKGIIEDIDPGFDPERRPSPDQDTLWWPGLIPFAVDFGGDHLLIDVRTSHVYSEFEGGVYFRDIGHNKLEAPQTFRDWLADYAARLEAGKFRRDANTGGTLWMYDDQGDDEKSEEGEGVEEGDSR